MVTSHAEFYRGLEAAAGTLQHLASRTARVRATAVHAAITPLLRATDAADRVACGTGCSHCCHYPVGVTFGEALLLADAVRGDAALVELVRQDAAATADVAWHDLVGRPCPLLRDGACSCYQARPLPCRALASTDAVACQRALIGGADVPRDEQAFWRGLGAGAALADETPPGVRELRAAVASILAAVDDQGTKFAAARPAG